MTSKEVLEKLRRTKLLSIQDYDVIQPIDGQGGWSRIDSKATLTDYDRTYPDRLKEHLGVELVIARSKELIGEIGKVEEKKAENIADMWIDEAKEVVNVTRKDVVRSAFLYVAYKGLMKKYDADAITISSWALIPDGKIKAMPPLAEMELAKELIPCCCESLIDCSVTQMIGTYISGRPSFVGDQVSNWDGLRQEDAVDVLPENYVAIGHCYGPINPHGNDRVPYVIRDHAYYELGWGRTDDPRALWRREEHLRANRQLKEENITLVGIRAELPVDEVVSIVKFDPYNKKAQVFTGKTFDPYPFFEDFDNTKCRTKMAIKTDIPFKNRIGGHLVAFYGNLKEEFKDFAKLTGFDFIEMDIKEIERQIEELKANWPAHSVPNWMYERLEELEEALEKRKSPKGGKS